MAISVDCRCFACKSSPIYFFRLLSIILSQLSVSRPLILYILLYLYISVLIYETHFFYFYTFFVEPFHFSLLAFFPNLFVQSLIYCALPWLCIFPSLFSCLEISSILFFSLSILIWDDHNLLYH